MLVLVVVAMLADAATPRVRAEIVVTAAREEQPRDEAAAAVTLLTREELERTPAASLSEVLAFVPGVTMRFDGGSDGVPMITSRGFFGGGEVEYMKLLVDGVPVGDAESGNVDWLAVRLADVERIEVLHGPGSSLYGDTALGGVVQVFSRRERADRGDVRAMIGGDGLRDFGASFASPSFTARGSSFDSDGFREHAAMRNRQVALAWWRDAWRIDGTAVRADCDDPGPLTREEARARRTQSNVLFHDDGDATDRTRLSVSYDTQALRAAVYGIHRDGETTRTLLLAPGIGSTAVRSLATDAGGASLEATREVFGGTMRAGGDVERANVDGRYGDDARERGHRDRAGFFVTGGWSAGARTRISAGLRRDDIRDDFGAHSSSASAWSPRAGINIHFGDRIAAFAQWSHAFKAATLDQLFDPRPYPDGQGGTFTVSNPDLRPQRARNLEAGIARAGTTAEWSLVAYRMTVTDEIDFDPQTYSYHNIGSSLHRGVEASAGAFLTARLSPRVTYAWTHVVDAAQPGQQLKNIPEHVAQLMLHARIDKATNANVIYRWTSGITIDDEGAFTQPSVLRVDLRVAHDFGALRVHADVLNALDARSSELGFVLRDFSGEPTAFDYPAPGRSLRIGATWTF